MLLGKDGLWSPPSLREALSSLFIDPRRPTRPRRDARAPVAEPRARLHRLGLPGRSLSNPSYPRSLVSSQLPVRELPYKLPSYLPSTVSPISASYIDFVMVFSRAPFFCFTPVISPTTRQIHALAFLCRHPQPPHIVHSKRPNHGTSRLAGGWRIYRGAFPTPLRASEHLD